MAKIFRISGYLVCSDNDNDPRVQRQILEDEFIEPLCETWQQLHIEESETFEMDGEDQPNCDLALLVRHFKKDTPTEYDRPVPKDGEIWKHFKGEGVEVVGLSRHTETEELLVTCCYRNQIWCRPLDMFMSEVDHKKYPDVQQKYRFERVEPF